MFSKLWVGQNLLAELQAISVLLVLVASLMGVRKGGVELPLIHQCEADHSCDNMKCCNNYG